MKADELSTQAESLATVLNGHDARLLARVVGIERRFGPYRDRFRDTEVPKANGAYWLFRADGEVFYIGRAVDSTLWSRITSHPGQAEWSGDPAANYKQTVGAGWGFPAYKKLNNVRISETTRSAIREGDFYVGWIAVEPPAVGAVIETYLQSLSLVVDGTLPEFCDKVG